MQTDRTAPSVPARIGDVRTLPIVGVSRSRQRTSARTPSPPMPIRSTRSRGISLQQGCRPRWAPSPVRMLGPGHRWETRPRGPRSARRSRRKGTGFTRLRADRLARGLVLSTTLASGLLELKGHTAYVEGQPIYLPSLGSSASTPLVAGGSSEAPGERRSNHGLASAAL